MQIANNNSKYYKNSKYYGFVASIKHGFVGTVGESCMVLYNEIKKL